MSRTFAPENEGVLAPLSVPAQGGEARWWGEGLAVIKARTTTETQPDE